MDIPPAAAAAHRFDLLLGTHLFDQLYGRGFATFGALPSLHVAYPFIAAILAFRIPALRFARLPAILFFLLIRRAPCTCSTTTSSMSCWGCSMRWRRSPWWRPGAQARRAAGLRMRSNDRISRALAFAVSLRVPLLVAYALLVTAAAWKSAHIPSEGGIDRLIVPSDPDYAATRAFQRIFPESHSVLLVFESDDPWSPASLARIEAAKAALRDVPRVSAFTILDALRRARPRPIPPSSSGSRAGPTSSGGRGSWGTGS